MKKVLCLIVALLMLTMITSCDNTISNESKGSAYSDNSTKTLEERKNIAENAVAAYIHDYMKSNFDTGKYSIIDYDNMRFKASSSANGDIFTVKIDVYHYDSYGNYVGKNSNIIKASAKVDKYGIVSNVDAKNFVFIEWAQ